MHGGSELAPVETVDRLLARREAELGDRPFLRFAEGELTFAEVDARVDAVVGALADLGVVPGQLVPVLLPNGSAFVVTSLALCRLGAVPCLVNTALRGPALAGYMVPRYIDVVDQLPRTPTEKIEKRLLQERGVTATTWDREAWLPGP
jgi:acyl-CoA synthetase (AMP-forming)/AMP-acid ligase II